MEDWADQLDLRLVNEGNIPTCVRTQRVSIVDLTWSSPGLISQINKWQVLKDYENYTDHEYITYELNLNQIYTDRFIPLSPFPKWSFHKMDVEKYTAAAEFISNTTNWENVINDTIDECASWLENTVTDLCSFSTPRQGACDRTQSYWWTEKIHKLRLECNKKRRILTRIKRKTYISHRGLSEIDCKKLPVIISARKELRIAKNALVTEIRRSKILSWRRLLDTLNKDPWSQPYKIVLNKLRKAVPSITRVLPPNQVSHILDELFPNNLGREKKPMLNDATDWNDNIKINLNELKIAIKGKNSGNVAPGPDGILKCAWTRLPNSFLLKILDIFNKSLLDGIFPETWKIAEVVLIPKGKKTK